MDAFAKAHSLPRHGSWVQIDATSDGSKNGLLTEYGNTFACFTVFTVYIALGPLVNYRKFKSAVQQCVLDPGR